ncbi:hypothetical protein SAMN02745121_04098 [Nannocystis exedens]|uniref:Uncharacterized protein n=1 Tax=Nannocystis exedens TaxID=54 RepID=A0A1I2A6R5_9BACT|nr:hypothetical protein [Nannocystis exedens]PCC69674.1 hypothetical protein NAEX_02698 [Nannocystis exedens]SFE39632.1 hypothetical protein SAMN02745121_04098 [Nannocystis exedens]
MAPRPLEPLDHFIARLRRSAPLTAGAQVRFGGHHFSHAVVVEDGRWRVRPLVLDRARADAFLQERGYFMPENAEDLSEPGDPVVLEADSLEGLIELLRGAKWPMW